MRIQHNIAALSSYRNLTNNNSAVSKNLEKLSSGYRINRAGDDAAGLAISEKMRAQITGLETAQKNANDGISLIQTAEGALTEVHSMLNRMVELANQSANGTYMDEDRDSLQAEVNALLDEINRISKSTNFNGRTLLNGDMETKTTVADEVATGFKDAVKVFDAIAHIADGAQATNPIKGEFSLDLTSLVMRNDGVKANITTAPAATDIGTITDGTDAAGAKFEVSLADAVIEKVEGADDQGTLNLTVGDQIFNIAIPDAGIPTAGAGWTAGTVGSITLQDDNGDDVEFTGAIDATGKITFTAANGVHEFTKTDTSAIGVSLEVGTPSNAPVKATITIGTKSLGEGIEIKSGDSMTGAEWAEAFVEDLKENGDGSIEIDSIKYNVSNKNGKLTFTMVDDPTKDFDSDLTVKLEVKDAGDNVLAKVGGNGADNDGDTIQNDNDLGVFINQGHGIGVHMDIEPSYGGDRVLAQGSLDLSAIEIKDGTALKIGDETYIFALGADSQFKNAANVVDLTKYEKIDDTGALQAAANKLSKVAEGNKMFDISTRNTGLAGADVGKVFLTERKDSGIDYKKNKLDGDDPKDLLDADKEAWRGLIQVGKGNPDAKPAVTSGGLVLQIGDTSDSFNQLTVSVGDMSANALGIGSIDISTQEGAAAAVDQIKAAINKVSAQRGDLGALQNRLEHTINNLSVTTENITAAESRIRDVDMAKEMMAYTKNNILVQASQAMLAQANQIPQGVLQLLQ